MFSLIGRFFFVFLCLNTYAFKAHAEAACGFSRTLSGPLSFRQIEMISRAHSIGLWRGGDVTLKSWIEVGPNAVLGIDTEGRVLNVLKLQDRTVAKLLSGERIIKDLFYFQSGHLLAIDDKGHWLEFHHQLWGRNPLSQIMAKGLGIYGTAMCSVSLALLSYSFFWEVPFASIEILGSLGATSIGAAMIEGFRGSVAFEQQNEMTDGFRPIGFHIENFRLSEPVLGPDNGIVDYMVIGDFERASVKDIAAEYLEKPSENFFHRSCADLLLPRGVPPSRYEPL